MVFKNLLILVTSLVTSLALNPVQLGPAQQSLDTKVNNEPAVMYRQIVNPILELGYRGNKAAEEDTVGYDYTGDGLPEFVIIRRDLRFNNGIFDTFVEYKVIRYNYISGKIILDENLMRIMFDEDERGIFEIIFYNRIINPPEYSPEYPPEQELEERTRLKDFGDA